jgi:hypothetical protein
VRHCVRVLNPIDGTNLEKDGTVPAETDGQAADGDYDALLLLPQLFAHRLPPHVQVPVLRSQRTPTKEKKRKERKVHVFVGAQVHGTR